MLSRPHTSLNGSGPMKLVCSQRNCTESFVATLLMFTETTCGPLSISLASTKYPRILKLRPRLPKNMSLPPPLPRKTKAKGIQSSGLDNRRTANSTPSWMPSMGLLQLPSKFRITWNDAWLEECSGEERDRSREENWKERKKLWHHNTLQTWSWHVCLVAHN